jgi:hypothetical protein
MVGVSVRYSQVSKDLTEALQLPIGQTLGRMDAIIVELAQFQNNAEDDLKRVGLLLM